MKLTTSPFELEQAASVRDRQRYSHAELGKSNKSGIHRRSFHCNAGKSTWYQRVRLRE
ncbi:hypothetical protein RESH_02125 [Rhodopirellula europaea SH398]|uniref:Uncharacterized protein n=1 Tax=Rhodopirellula europaea SH398 TaxID=1263868 RepID=M5S704_9BACT|nr:hypothetical protein RESH_02125 [Rhodopirellula europaea SH398]